MTRTTFSEVSGSSDEESFPQLTNSGSNDSISKKLLYSFAGRFKIYPTRFKMPSQGVTALMCPGSTSKITRSSLFHAAWKSDIPVRSAAVLIPS